MKKDFLFETQGNRKGNTGREVVALKTVSTPDRKEKDMGSVPVEEFAAGDSPKTGIKGYRETFLSQRESVGRKQTYIGCEVYSQLNNILPVIGNGISIPTFLNNVLEHHLRTYKNEIGVLLHNRIQKIQQTEAFTPTAKETEKNGISTQSGIKEYEDNFHIRSKTAQRRQTYIDCDLYVKLGRILSVLESDVSIPVFLNNMLVHHLKTYRNEIEELFHESVEKMEF